MYASTLTGPMFDPWKDAHWSENEAIPASEVQIRCKNDLQRGVVDVLVTPFPDDRNYFADHWDGTSGACHSDWLKPGQNTMTPENVFGELAGKRGSTARLKPSSG